MRKDRILALAQLIENLPEDKFNMEFWFASGIGGEYPYYDLDVEDFSKVANSCGTAACIAGWACYMMDLELKINPDDSEMQEVFAENTYPKDIATWYLDIDYRVAYKLFYTEASSFWKEHSSKLGIDDLFDEDEYVNSSMIKPSHAAKMLRMIANNEIVGIHNGVLMGARG